MIAYQTNRDGVYVGPIECDESPLEPGVYHVPGGAVVLPPPAVGEEQFARWDGEKWRVEFVEKPEPEPEPVFVPTIESVRAERRQRYAVETDGMFFAAQREGGDLAAWEAAVAAIKADLPYPDAP